MNSIKKLREDKGLSQIQLADKIGVGQSTVSTWETGDSLPRADKLPQLAAILGCKIDDLFGKAGKEVNP